MRADGYVPPEFRPSKSFQTIPVLKDVIHNLTTVFKSKAREHKAESRSPRIDKTDSSKLIEVQSKLVEGQSKLNQSSIEVDRRSIEAKIAFN